ncbi:MAG: SIMPL domain-containing protein, partial [Candidatus Sungiibacteriota bacterium]
TVLTEGASLIDAQKENTGRSNAVTDFLKKSSVAEKDAKTVGYNIFPQYSYPRPCRVLPCLEDETPKIIGYQIRHTLAITIRDITKAGDILSGVVEAGANEVSSLEFAIDEPDALKAEARKKAIDDARAKAERLAEGLGKRVGKIIDFSESGYFPGPIPFAAEAFGKGGGAAPSPEIQPGENEITVNVSVTYEFK